MSDWAKFDTYPEATCYCRCGVVFRSHSQIDMHVCRSISRKPCPGCGKQDELRRVSHDPETDYIHGAEGQEGKA